VNSYCSEHPRKNVIGPVFVGCFRATNWPLIVPETSPSSIHKISHYRLLLNEIFDLTMYVGIDFRIVIADPPYHSSEVL